MKWIQLYRDGEEIIASDGVLPVYTKLFKEEVIERNKRFEKNFPHKVADEFAVYRGRIGSEQGKRIKL
jgi:hypothetical protein